MGMKLPNAIPPGESHAVHVILGAVLALGMGFQHECELIFCLPLASEMKVKTVKTRRASLFVESNSSFQILEQYFLNYVVLLTMLRLQITQFKG